MKDRKFYTCCFTGHRSKNLPWGYKEKGMNFLFLKINSKRLLNNLLKLDIFIL